MVCGIFRWYGTLAASHPWEVVVGVITFTTCCLSLIDKTAQPPTNCYRTQTCRQPQEEYWGVETILMTTVRCMAILYTYHHLIKLRKLESNYLLCIAGIFVMFSSFVCSVGVITFLNSDLGALKDSLFLFLLLVNWSKVSLFAQVALSATSTSQIEVKIGNAMSYVGPVVTLDAIVETLVIGIGTLSGVKRLEMLSMFACLNVTINYIIFMTFYPAVLSLILEMSSNKEAGVSQPWELKEVAKVMLDDLQKHNPVVQQVKLIMSAGLLLIHLQRKFVGEAEKAIVPEFEGFVTKRENATGRQTTESQVLKIINGNVEQVVIAIIVITLFFKYFFFERWEHKNLQDNYAASERQGTEKIGPPTFEASCQTDPLEVGSEWEQNTAVDSEVVAVPPPRSMEQLTYLLKERRGEELTDDEVVLLMSVKKIPLYGVEGTVGDHGRGVQLRRRYVQQQTKTPSLQNLLYTDFDYKQAKSAGACCENPIGYTAVPTGVVGPLKVDGGIYWFPLATTEGCLVGSVNRGVKAASAGDGINTHISKDGMSRAPVLQFNSLREAVCAEQWLKENFITMKKTFESTSNFAKLTELETKLFGKVMYVRFVATTGDAMGMNMVSKGVEKCLRFLKEDVPECRDMKISALSGNYCTDKKPSAVNWIKGRGKSVTCDCVISRSTMESVLKTSARAFVEVVQNKIYMGSAAAGSIGGFNSHSANMLAAAFIATGQDPAQVVEGSQCLTDARLTGDNEDDLYISCTIPSLEVATVGGGTSLAGQQTCLTMLGIQGANRDSPAENSRKLARLICSVVLCGELSTISALASGDLVKSHLQHNRSQVNLSSMNCATRL